MSPVSFGSGARKRAICLLGLVCGLSPAHPQGSTDSSPGDPSQSPRLPVTVGTYTDSYPYSYVDAGGHPAGFAVDILDAVARAVNISIKRVEGPAVQIRDRFKNGEFRMLQYHGIPYAGSPNAEFSVPMLSLQGCVYVKAGGAIRALRDLDGQPFGVMGTTGLGEKFLQDFHIKARVVPVPSREVMLRKISSGEIAGAFLSQLSELSVIHELRVSNVAKLGGPYEGYEIRQAFAVHRGDSELLARLNEGLAIIHRSGEYDRIYKKNFSQLGSYILTTGELELYASVAMALALVVALWGYLRQSKLRKAISGQALKLAEQGALLRALYDNIPMAMTVVETGPGGPRVLSMNRQAYSLYSIESEVSGMSLEALPVSEEVRRLLAESAGLRPGPAVAGTHETTLKAGRRVVEVTAIPLTSLGSPESSRICVLVEDITERKKQEDEIVRSRKLRAVGELVGGIAHEFNNLLTPIMLKAGEIQFLRQDDAELQRDIEVITQAVQRTAELTRRLLAFGRKAEHRPETVSVAAIATGCFDLLKNTVDRRICWKHMIPDDLPPLYFNATDLNQILINLLLNARDALMERLVGRYPPDWKPTITVEVRQLPPSAFAAPSSPPGKELIGWQQIAVSDNGLGMPTEVVERIFEPFFTTKEVGKGTGLGLATVWHLVNGAGGTVKVESTMGSGSAFNIFLPVWPASNSSKKARVPAAPSGSVRILLVEDESLVALPLAQALRRQGHSVRSFENGLDAWNHLEGNLGSYDLLILDVNLPGMNGIDIVARVRGGGFPGRIFMVSGRFTSSDMSALTRLGIDHSLTKPFDMQQFMNAVHETLAATKP